MCHSARDTRDDVTNRHSNAIRCHDDVTRCYDDVTYYHANRVQMRAA